MTWRQFGVGLAVLAALLVLAQSMQAAVAEPAEMVGYAIGGVVGAMIWPVAVWWVIRLIRGESAAPDQRRFVLVGSYIIAGLALLMRMGR